MARRVTPKDGADATAMLDSERATRKRAPRLHLDPATGATVLAPLAMQAHEVKAKAPAKKATKQTKADKVRAAYLADPNARPIDVAKATGVEASYVWDVRQAMRRAGTLPMPESKAVAS